MDAGSPVEVLRRWKESGGIWRVLARHQPGLVIALITCTGDEEMGRLASGNAELVAYVGSRTSSEE
jgi:hypothetical protein